MDDEQKIDEAFQTYRTIAENPDQASFKDGARKGIQIGEANVWERLFRKHTSETIPHPDDVYNPMFFKVMGKWWGDEVTFWDGYGIQIDDPDNQEELQRIPWALVELIYERNDIPDPWDVLNLEA